MKTPEVVKHHSMKQPPPLLMSVGELLQLINQLSILMAELFMSHCSLDMQLQALYLALQEWEHKLIGNLGTMAHLIPQVIWAITEAAQDFYSTVCTHQDIVPPEGVKPHFTIANIHIHTSMLKASIKLDLMNVPEQWKPHQDCQHSTVASALPKTSNKSDQNNKHCVLDPFQATGNSAHKREVTTITNPHHPAIFANNDAIKQLQDASRLILTNLISEAGLQVGIKHLALAGLSDKICLHYIIFRKCCSITCKKCNQSHPQAAISASAVNSLFQLKLGLQCMAAKQKWIHTNQ